MNTKELYFLTNIKVESLRFKGHVWNSRDSFSYIADNYRIMQTFTENAEKNDNTT